MTGKLILPVFIFCVTLLAGCANAESCPKDYVKCGKYCCPK
jgi:hypothetical protein